MTMPPSLEEIQLFEKIESQLLARHYNEWLSDMEEIAQHPYDFNDAEQEEH